MSGGGPRQVSTVPAAAPQTLAKRLSAGPEIRQPAAANENERTGGRQRRALVALAFAVAAVSAGLTLTRFLA